MFNWLTRRLNLIDANTDYIAISLNKIVDELADIRRGIANLEGIVKAQPARFETYKTHIVPINEMNNLTTEDPRDQTIRELADDIRNMDQLIHTMGQCSDWSSMRPHFLKLVEGCKARQRAESDRINNLLRKELIKTYAPRLEEPKQ